MYKKKHIHFVGIGGIGMSGIAEILHQQGHTISGCDNTPSSKVLNRLKKNGCSIFHEHCSSHIDSADILVYSSDIDKNTLHISEKRNPDIKAALQKKIPIVPRAAMLAELMKSKESIAIAGMHGKTTTTSLLSHIFIEAGKNPTVISGGILKNYDTNALYGTSSLLIAEADESDRSLLCLNPTVALITNINREHLDVYADFEDIQTTFKQFLARLPFYGKAFACIDDSGVQSLFPITHVPIVTYGFSEQAQMRCVITNIEPEQTSFDVFYMNTFLGNCTLSLEGTHNISNALGAIALALEFDIPFVTIQHALTTFQGVERRFEFKGHYKKSIVFDDYGHHPREIECVLEVAHKKKKNKLIVLFQPQRYSRTEKLWNEFIELFVNCKADVVHITDIYSANEPPKEGISSARLVQEIIAKNPTSKIYYTPLDFLESSLQLYSNEENFILTLGAGKLNLFADYLVSKEINYSEDKVLTV